MKLKTIRIHSFQSFLDSGEINFQAGINLIVGQNNSGKSAVLRALRPAIPHDSHRNVENWDAATLDDPRIESEIIVTSKELRSAFYQAQNSYIKISDNEKLESIISSHDSNEINLNFDKLSNGSFQYNFNIVGEYIHSSGSNLFTGISKAGSKLRITPNTMANGDTWGNIIFSIHNSSVFFFNAERMNVGEYPHGYAQRLEPNASNLPAVLHTLNGERGDKFARLVEHLREIFATVGNISVRTNHLNPTKLEIRVWPTEAQERVEMSFPLDQSGTGVSQTIALLTAIMTMENAVIIIDEINSFLHPSAVKALLRIIQTEYSSHQYIISTHAPEVISFSNPSTIHLVKKSGYESTVEKLNIEDVDAFRSVAEHLGVSMSDVFAADKIIWVEGPTEELCFPWLYRQAMGKPLPKGITFVSVVATGDFIAKRRDRKLIYEIYDRISCAATPLVVSVAFSFDSEELSPEEKVELVKESQNKMHFLPRRHLECFLLDPEAIAAFINEQDKGQSQLSSGDVSNKLIELASTPSFNSKTDWNGDIADEVWQSQVDAAKLISKACGELSDHRVTFKKKADSLFLLQHIQKHASASLETLKNYVCELVE